MQGRAFVLVALLQQQLLLLLGQEHLPIAVLLVFDALTQMQEALAEGNAPSVTVSNHEIEKFPRKARPDKAHNTSDSPATDLAPGRNLHEPLLVNPGY